MIQIIVFLGFRETAVDFEDHASLICRHIAPIPGDIILSKKSYTMRIFRPTNDLKQIDSRLSHSKKVSCL
jgi:hypothetical protein